MKIIIEKMSIPVTLAQENLFLNVYQRYRYRYLIKPGSRPVNKKYHAKLPIVLQSQAILAGTGAELLYRLRFLPLVLKQLLLKQFSQKVNYLR